MKLLLLGASGLVGKNILAQALADPAIASVVAPTRRALPPHPTLTNPVSDKLESLAQQSEVTRGADAVVCALGTTIGKAGSKEAFRAVDYELPLAFARAAHAQGTEIFVLISSGGASATSRFFYTRVKGEVERDIQLVGFKSLTIVQPSLIGGERDESRRAEKLASILFSVFAPILPKKLKINPAPNIAAASLKAATSAAPGLHYRRSETMV
jgi:uncharacterized protein YbjT (DUF2867 family)